VWLGFCIGIVVVYYLLCVVSCEESEKYICYFRVSAKFDSPRCYSPLLNL
jgi:hypothetical protein